MKYRILLYVLPTAALFFNGCAIKTAVNNNTLKTPPAVDTITSYQNDVETTDTLKSEPLCPSIDSLFFKTDQYCRKDLFSEADSLIKDYWYSHKDLNCYTSGEEEIFYSSITRLYTEIFPVEFLDRLDEEMAFTVFKMQLAVPIDSLIADIPESTLSFIPECAEGKPYNYPIVLNDRVKKSLQLLVRRKGRQFEKWLSKAYYYYPVMKKCFSDSQLPTDLAFLPLIESGFNPKAYSYAHASGIWQFIASTGRRYGLEYNYWVDERRDPVLSTLAAVKYLSKLYSDFDDWHLASAAYNCGENRIKRELKNNKDATFWDMRLPLQTMNYVPGFTASLIVAKNPGCFGIDTLSSDTFNLDTFSVEHCLDMRKISDELEISFDLFKNINPHIRRWCTPPDKKSTLLYLPNGKRDAFKSYIDNLSDKDKVRWYRYKVRYGDNLISIANHFKTSVWAIKSLNSLNSSRIVAGKHIFIPIPVNTNYPPQEQKTVSRSAQNVFTGKEENKLLSKGYVKNIYSVHRGDVLIRIAEKFNTDVNQICLWNGISNPKSIKAGDKLNLYIKKDSLKKESGNNTAAVKNTLPVGNKKYIVKRGDNLYSISIKLGTELELLSRINNISMSKPIIHEGDTLLYSTNITDNFDKQETDHTGSGNTCKNCIKYKIQKGDNLSYLADIFSVDISTIMRCNNLNQNDILRKGDIILIPSSLKNKKTSSLPDNRRMIYYTVKQGDNLWSISKLFNTSLNRICEVNNLTEKSIIKRGDRLKIFASEEM